MGYFTGTYLDLENRVHFWPTGIDPDLNQFIAEATGYVPFLTTGNPIKIWQWNKEFVRKYEIFDSPSGTFSLG